ncbi:MAG: tRNA uridine-5-carboxymethylaminomethyl(34) synthesis GTPase MnmE [Epsilonproteobacteria bacterium]|nr:tRNA uridine-5-carboxymethylaminomethyl(34) synthesis GTPase MnmE [Campylobacterota bacterium]
MTDTIVAISTAHAKGAISIVRMSGSLALDIAKKVTDISFKPREAKLAKFYDGDELIDIVLVLYFQAPKSFTGEDVVEFHCHGGLAVTKMVLDTLVKHGARIALAGEFTKRAFLNGKIDMTQAEAIAKLIDTKSKQSVKILSKQLRGSLGEFTNKIREDLIEIMAYVEVNIDYAYEDLPPDLVSQIIDKLNAIKDTLHKTLIASKKREGMFNGYKVAIIGKPNVGKSTLLNNLLNYNRAIVSDIAGTTRDTIEEEITLANHVIKIVDTAGIRDKTNDTIEKIGIERSKEALNQSDIVIAIFDSSREFDSEDMEIVQLLKNTNKDILVALNKTDLPPKLDTTLLEEFKPISITKYDSDVVERKLEEILENYEYEENILITSRQIQQVQKAYDEIVESFELLNSNQLELFSYHIQNAIMYIASITKPFEHDEMLEKMFGTFCVGK